MALVRTVVKQTPSGLVEIVWNGSVARMEFNCSCLDALELCHGMCCNQRTGYLVELEADEIGKYLSRPHPSDPTVRILQTKKDRSCVYQLEDGKCGIHDLRPKECRKWHCSPKGEEQDIQIERRDAGWLLTPMRAEEAKLIDSSPKE